MDNLYAFYIETQKYSDQLYQNTVESYNNFRNYAVKLQDFSDALAGNQEKEQFQLCLQITQALLAAYQDQNLLCLSDILKGNLLPLIYDTANSEMQDKIDQYNKVSDLQKKDKLNCEKVASRKETIGQDWLDRNLNTFSQAKRKMYDSMVKYLRSFNENDDSVLIDMEGSIAVAHGDKWWYVNSTVDSEYASNCWLKSQNAIGENDILIICGMSNCSYLRALLSKLSSDNIVVVYEPDPRIFAVNMLYTDLTDFIGMDNLFFLVEGVNMEMQEELISGVVNYYTTKYTKFYALPGYEVAYSNQISVFIEKCQKSFEEMVLQNNTILRKNQNVNYNVIMNLKYMMNGSDIDEMKSVFESADATKLPAIIVAAGPSLDKNIRDLKAAEGKAFIVGTDSSLRMLMKYEIKPDIIVTLDPDKERVLFEDDRVNDIPMVYSVHATHDILEKNRAKKILFSNMSFVNHMYENLGKSLSAIDPGGSVANAGFAVARFLGFTDIIMIGQDLAFTDNKKHASDVYEEKAVGDDNKDMYITIEGMNGEPLLAYANFKAYRDWYERMIEFDHDLTFVNATEGGARIHGAIEMTLKDAISKYCSKIVNFSELIAACKNSFSQQQKEQFKIKVESYIKECDHVWRIARNLNHFYDEMILARQPEKAVKISSKCDALVAELEKSDVMEFISYYAREQEVQATESLYDVKDTHEKSVWRELGERGKVVAASYQKYAAQTKQLFEKSYEELISK